MVGVQAYCTARVNTETPAGAGEILPGSFNVASAIQDSNNVNAGVVRLDFKTPFMFPPVAMVQGVRVLVEWASPGSSPFHPDGTNVHREIFPLPPNLAIDGEVDEILDTRIAKVDDATVSQPTASRVEIERLLLNHRLLRVERKFVEVQFASFVGKKVRVRPFTLKGLDSANDVQEGTITEVLFGFLAAGDLDAF